MPYLGIRQAFFGPYCPSGGDWYACSSGSNFVGCCRIDPCVADCPIGDLEPASFDPAFYGKFPDQQCPKGSQWYTCADATPAFMGCCKSNPCESGCPIGDLTPGFLSSNPADACAFQPAECSASPTTSEPASPTAPATMSTTAPPEHSHTPTRVVVGAATGGAVGFILIILLVVHWYRHTALTRKRQTEEAQIGEKESGSPYTSFKDGKLVSSPATGGSGRSSTTNTPMIVDPVQNAETVEPCSQQPSSLVHSNHHKPAHHIHLQ
jgi:hypothetical protein